MSGNHITSASGRGGLPRCCGCVIAIHLNPARMPSWSGRHACLLPSRSSSSSSSRQCPTGCPAETDSDERIPPPLRASERERQRCRPQTQSAGPSSRRAAHFSGFTVRLIVCSGRRGRAVGEKPPKKLAARLLPRPALRGIDTRYRGDDGGRWSGAGGQPFRPEAPCGFAEPHLQCYSLTFHLFSWNNSPSFRQNRVSHRVLSLTYAVLSES